METDPMDINAHFAAVKARRAAAGLVADNGTHCATTAQRDYMNLRDKLRARADWGALPADLEAQLIAARNAA